jgi:hypothetical protein
LNPDINSCIAKCVAGACKVEVDPTKIQATSNAFDSYKTIVTSLWNGDKATLVFSPPLQSNATNAVVSFQALRADKTKNGAPVSFALPTTQLTVTHLAATLRGNKVGLLWHGVQSVGTSTPSHSLQFAETDFQGTSATPTVLSQNTVGTSYPEDGTAIFLAPVKTDDYVMLKFGGTPDSWKGYAGAPATASVNGTPLMYSPVENDSSATLIGSTVFVTGWNCGIREGSCPKQLSLQRYSTSDLSALGESSQLSTLAYDGSTASSRLYSPVLGVIAGKVVAFWNENGKSGLELVRDQLNEAGVYQPSARVTTATNLIPKAIAEYRGGGGILFAARASAASPDAYELVAQRFDPSLKLVGDAYLIEVARLGEPTQVEARVDSTGTRVIVTLHHATDAFYTLLHAGLCQ